MVLFRFFNVRHFAAILTLGILTAVIPSLSIANEILRIAGMGGTRIATAAEDAGIFGNPASLVGVKHHNLALGATAENIHWAELPKQGTVQFATEANIDISPAFYYSHAFGKWGTSAGYAARFTNFVDFTLESTRAEYRRNSRQFSATTDLFTRYDLLQERSWTIGISRELGKSATGLRLRVLKQVVNRGMTISTLNLEARHGPEVDVDVPEELIEAIVEELQFGDRVRDIVHEHQPTLERTVNRLELDIGFQRPIWFDPKQTNPPLLVGVLFENLLRADLVEPHPFRVGMGAAYEPLEWLTVAADLWRDFGQKGISFAVGSEFQKTWTEMAPKTVALRLGAGRTDATLHFSFGVGLRLGTTYLEYALMLGNFTYESDKHLLAFTLRF
ncbi:MAG: hypothetical protein OXG97_14120 [Candidatus Poribacteria bacterium]|nr:hypothetical protein [Candidatus Poribacteria bacterium]